MCDCILSYINYLSHCDPCAYVRRCCLKCCDRRDQWGIQAACPWKCWWRLSQMHGPGCPCQHLSHGTSSHGTWWPRESAATNHKLSYLIISCLFMSIHVSCFGILEPSFAHIHLAIIWHWTSLSSFADVGPCYSSVMREILSVQRVQDPSCLAEPTPAVVFLAQSIMLLQSYLSCVIFSMCWKKHLQVLVIGFSTCLCLCCVVCVCVRVSARARDKDFSCWRQCNN